MGRHDPVRSSGRDPERAFRLLLEGRTRRQCGYGAPLDTVVTFTLKKVEGGTRLRLVHSGFVLPRNDTAYRNMSGGWNKVVPRIGAITGEHASSSLH